MKQLISTIRRYVNILVTVIVIVADRNSHAVAGALQARFLGPVLECAIRLLMVEAIPVKRAGLFGDGPLANEVVEGCAIDEKNVQTAIIISIEKCHPRTHGLDQILV